MSDRLRELQHQRRLVQEQLAWLDGEIAAAAGNARSAPPQAPATTATPVSSASSAPAATAATDAIIAKYQNETASLQGQVKRGCFVYFFLAFAVVGLGVLALYLYTTRK